MRPIQDIFSQLAIPKKVVITMHQKPDADAMGSSLALMHFLKQLDHAVTVISPTNWADFMKWMPGVESVLDFESQGELAKEKLDQCEWLFCLDFNIFHRTRFMTDKLKNISCTKILIDHHQEPDSASFNFGVSDTSKSSTSEMVYDLIVNSGYKELINIDISECIYAGVIGDTGSFRFSSTHAGVHTLVAHLKSVGLNHGKVHEGLYDNFLENRLRFIGHVLLNQIY
jgi:phosphoesterase RecJ-like protein